jgi:hypothetical protein
MSEQDAYFEVDHSKESKNGYSIVPNALLRNQELSPNCRWLIIYLSSNAPMWSIKARQLINHCKQFMGRDQVYAILNEAIQAGYILREEFYVNGLKRVKYTVSSDGRFKNTQDLEKRKSLSIYPLPENPDTERQDTENQDAKELPSSKNYQEEGNIAMPSARSPFLPSKRKKEKEPSEEIAPEVHLTKKQQDALLKNCDGEEAKRKACYEKLSKWKIGKGVTGGNDYMAMQNWVIGAVLEDLSKPKASDRSSKDREFAKRIGKSFPGHRDITVAENYIEFNFGPNNSPHIKFGDGGFEEQVTGCLRKMGLKLID